MSYILEALRKSERERQHAEPLVLNPIGSETTEPPHRWFGPLTGTVVLLVGAIAFGAFWIFATGRLGVTTPASPSAGLSGKSNAMTAGPTDVAGPRAVEKILRPAPELKLSPFAAGRQRSSLRDLAKEARIEAPAAAPSKPPVSAAPSVTEKAVAAPSAVNSLPQDASIKFLRAMPPEFQHTLPHLAVTIHIYAPREADRILYINNRQYHVGDQIENGIVVREIVPDGAVLSYRGQLFKLPRPT